ncbi:MAG: hypothetical protein MZU97_12325 [Bacillus subtilis]|nr:hypothetical protein [Bacillus subtilis]
MPEYARSAAILLLSWTAFAAVPGNLLGSGMITLHSRESAAAVLDRSGPVKSEVPHPDGPASLRSLPAPGVWIRALAGCAPEQRSKERSHDLPRNRFHFRVRRQRTVPLRRRHLCRLLRPSGGEEAGPRFSPWARSALYQRLCILPLCGTPCIPSGAGGSGASFLCTPGRYPAVRPHLRPRIRRRRLPRGSGQARQGPGLQLRGIRRLAFGRPGEASRSPRPPPRVPPAALGWWCAVVLLSRIMARLDDEDDAVLLERHAPAVPVRGTHGHGRLSESIGSWSPGSRGSRAHGHPVRGLRSLLRHVRRGVVYPRLPEAPSRGFPLRRPALLPARLGLRPVRPEGLQGLRARSCPGADGLPVPARRGRGRNQAPLAALGETAPHRKRSGKALAVVACAGDSDTVRPSFEYAGYPGLRRRGELCAAGPVPAVPGVSGMDPASHPVPTMRSP